MKFTKQQTAHVLAALRFTQTNEDLAEDLADMDHFTGEGLTPLTSEEVDELCEALNFDDTTKVVVETDEHGFLTVYAPKGAIDLTIYNFDSNNDDPPSRKDFAEDTKGLMDVEAAEYRGKTA